MFCIFPSDAAAGGVTISMYRIRLFWCMHACAAIIYLSLTPDGKIRKKMLNFRNSISASDYNSINNVTQRIELTLIIILSYRIILSANSFV